MNLKHILSLTLAATCTLASAWSGKGHQQIADIAWSQLTHEAKVEIAEMFIVGDTLTRGERTSSFTAPTPTNGFSDDYLEHVIRPIFRKAASWPDDARNGTSTQFDARVDADNAASPGVNPPSGDTHRARGEEVRCKTWHYYNEPIVAPDDTTAHTARASNAVRALAIVRSMFEGQENSSKKDPKEQLYDLFWIEHVFGDLAQPLHCTDSFVLKPDGDEGGNGFPTMAPNTFRPGEPTSLHSFWDAGIEHAVAADPKLGEGSDVEKVSATWLADATASPSADAVKDLNPMDWVHEGYDLSVKFVYAGIKPMGVPDEAYQKNQVEVCRKQAVLAGTRLASYLNSVLKKGM
jgi:hypothetical protein